MKTAQTTAHTLLRTALNKAHAVGQDDFREGASDMAVKRRYDELNASADALTAEISALQSTNAELAEAAREAAELLARIPAFGDSIGTEINKAQCGVALRKLKLALDRATQ